MDTTYYVKSISYVTSSITISDTYISATGVAGAVYNVTDAVGSMQIIIQAGGSYVWTEPVIYANGNKLVFGTTNQISQTKSGSNTIVTNSTSGIIIDTPVKFDLNMFGPDIVPLQTYYVKDIIDGNEFTISETLGGSVKTLSTQFGTATYITSDYAVGISSNGITAKIIFANQWDNSDYLAYTIFGEGIPFTYGYTLPQTQIIESDGSATYDLDNAIDSVNATNAIVEINGIRRTTDYTIDHITDQITFSSTIPTIGDTIAVTTFNDTGRQYFNTEYNITGATVSAISGINNELSAPVVVAATTTTAPDLITLTDATGVFVGQPIQFKGTSFGGVAVDGTVYWVQSKTGLQITLSPDPDLVATLAVSNDTGLMIGYVGGLEAVRVTTATPHGFASPVNNDIKVRIDGTLGSTQLNNNSYYVHVIDDNTFDLYDEPYDPAYAATNYPVTTITSYTSGGYAWNQGTYWIYFTTSASTAASDNKINVVDASQLVVDTPVYFVDLTVQLGEETSVPGIYSGTKYYIKEVDIIANTIKISDSYKGITKTITPSLSSFTLYISQWEQANVDRLWVTINGYRVPSSKLRLNAASELSILSEISSGDSVTITSMIPTATPSQEVYVNMIATNGDPSVYRINTFAQTWLTKGLYEIQNEIFVHDVTKLTNTVTQTATVSSPVDGFYEIGLIANKNEILRVTVYNVTTASEINYEYINLVLINSAPVVQIVANPAYISAGDEIIITTLTGKNIWVNGEIIKITKIDVDNNIITGFQRGADGTSIQAIIPVNTPVIGLLEDNRLPDTFYNKTWNSDNYNTTLGDPLQISNTPAAVFLRTDIT